MPFIYGFIGGVLTLIYLIGCGAAFGMVKSEYGLKLTRLQTLGYALGSWGTVLVFAAGEGG